MAAVDFGTLETRARVRADMENSSFITDWTPWINAAADELYDLLVRKFNDRFVTSYAFSTVAGTESYPLPADFYGLRGVDLQVDGVHWQTLKPFNFANRNALRNAPAAHLPWHTNARYWLKGSVLTILPVPSSIIAATLWYIPARPQMADTSDSFDFGPGGWEEYVVIDAAIRALAKEESDTSQLMAEKAAIIDRINRSAANRDAGTPRTAQDVSGYDPEGW